MTYKAFFKTVGFICVLLNIYIVIIAYEDKQKNAQKIELIKQKKKLEIFHASCKTTKVLEIEAIKLLKNLESKPLSELQNIVSEWKRNVEIPSNAFKIIAYNVELDKNKLPLKHTPLHIPDNEAEHWKRLMEKIDVFHKSTYKSISSDEFKSINLRLASLLIKQPFIIKQVNTTDLNTYAIWSNATKSVDKNHINSAIIIFHDLYIKPKKAAIVKSFFRQNNVNTDYYGYFNRNEPENYCLPPGLSTDIINKELSNSGFKSGYTDLKKIGIAAYAKPNGNIFIAIERKPFVQIPLWAISLWFIWFPIWYKKHISSNGEFKFSLKFISTTMIILVLFLPLTLITSYWHKMIESKREAIKHNKIANMFNNLMQLDIQFAETERLCKKIFDKVTNIVQKNTENPLGINNPKLFQKFIDESIKLELDMLIDQFYLTNENGNILSKTPLWSAYFRLLPNLPKYFRDSFLELCYADEWSPWNDEIIYISKPSANLDSFLKTRPQILIDTYMSPIKAISSELIDIYNQRHNKNTAGKSAKNTLSSGIFASMMGGKSEEYIASIYNNIGNFFQIGYAREIALLYTNVLLDKNGNAKYAVTFGIGQPTIIRCAHKRIFNNTKKWPLNTEYLAVTNIRWNTNYPYLDLWKRFKTVLNIVKPPINQYSTEVNINGEPYLLCAYKTNKIDFYTLLAITPIKTIEHEITKFKLKMSFVALLALAIIFYIFIKAYNFIFVPTNSLIKGINAIKNNNHDYKVVVETKDEWEKLAETFNSSLETMKELEVATFLQNTILPSKTISNDNISFSAQTISLDGIGGDYFDAFVADSKQMMFLFGDVSGHSIGAALVVSMAHAGFSSLFDAEIREPAEILKSFNNLMINNLKRVKMMTCFSGFIDSEGYLKFSNAGQTFPLIVNEQGEIIKAAIIGYPLGSAKKAIFTQKTIKLPDKCRIVLYSDGMIELMNEKNESFGYDRFELLVKELACKYSIEDFKKRIYREIKIFSGSVPWNDDCSIAIIDYNKNA